MGKDFDPAHAAAEGYTRADWDAVDSPELTDAALAELRPIDEAMPAFHAAVAAAIGERHPVGTLTSVTIRLDDGVVAAFRAMGPGWQTRINEVLREWLAKAG